MSDIIKNPRLVGEILKHLPLPLFIKNVEGKYVYLNPVLLEKTNKSLQDFLNRGDETLDRDALLWLSNDLRIFESNQTIKKDFVIGGKTYTIVKFSFQTSDGHKYLVGFAIDQTETLANLRQLSVFKQIIASMHDGLIIVRNNATQQFPIAYINKAFTKITGFTSKEALGRPYSFLYGIDTDAKTAIAIKRSLHKKEEFDGILQKYKKDKKSFWCHLKVLPLFNEKKEVSFFVILFRDISEVLGKREALQQSEERYSSIVEDQTELVCRFKKSGLLTYANKSFWTFFGGSENKNFYDFLSIQNQDFLDLLKTEISEKKSVFNITQKLINISGETRLINWVCKGIYQERTHNLLEYQCIGRDITDIQETQIALWQYEEKYKSIYDHTPALLQSLDESGRIEKVSAYWCKCLGYSVSDVIGKEFSYFLEKTSKYQFDTDIWPTYKRDGEIFNSEIQLLTKDGRIKYFLLSLVRNTELGIVTGVLNDISELVKIKNDLALSEKQFSSLFYDSYSLLLILNKNGLVKDVNKKVLETFNISRESLQEGPIWNAFWLDISPEQRQEFERNFKYGLFSDGLEQTFPLTIKERTYSIIIKPIHSKEGVVDYIMLEGRDVTEAKEEHDKLAGHAKLGRALEQELQVTTDKDYKVLSEQEVQDLIQNTVKRKAKRLGLLVWRNLPWKKIGILLAIIISSYSAGNLNLQDVLDFIYNPDKIIQGD